MFFFEAPFRTVSSWDLGKRWIFQLRRPVQHYLRLFWVPRTGISGRRPRERSFKMVECVCFLCLSLHLSLTVSLAKYSTQKTSLETWSQYLTLRTRLMHSVLRSKLVQPLLQLVLVPFNRRQPPLANSRTLIFLDCYYLPFVIKISILCDHPK